MLQICVLLRFSSYISGQLNSAIDGLTCVNRVAVRCGSTVAKCLQSPTEKKSASLVKVLKPRLSLFDGKRMKSSALRRSSYPMRFPTRNSMIDTNGHGVRASGDRFDMREAIREGENE